MESYENASTTRQNQQDKKNELYENSMHACRDLQNQLEPRFSRIEPLF